MIELRFIEREVNVATLEPNISTVRRVKILQQRRWKHLLPYGGVKQWTEWTDIPLVKLEDQIDDH